MKFNYKIMQKRILDKDTWGTNRGFREWSKVWFEERHLRYLSMLETEGMSNIIRQGKAFAHVLSNCSIIIYEEEPLFGTRIPTLPNKELNKEIDAYWKGRFENHIFLDSLTESDRLARDNCLVLTGARHFVLDNEWVLENGLNKLINDSKAKSAKTETSEELDFYQSLLTVYNAYLNYIKRYQEKLSNPELKKMCDNLLAEPPKSFHEALQAVWLLYLWAPDAFGRFDQYLFKYYNQDTKNNKLSREEAKCLLKAFYLKVVELVGLNNYSIFNMTLGGTTPSGEDACNDLTLLCLEVAQELNLINPGLSLRISTSTPQKIWEAATQLLKMGSGNPTFYNDDLIIPMLQEIAVSLKDARDYTLTGCAEITIPGRANYWSGAGYVNILKCVELALNNGFSFLDGYQLGVRTGKPESFSSFSEFYEAIKLQILHANKTLVRMLNLRDNIASQVSVMPQISAFMRDSFSIGKDYIAGGVTYNGTQSSGLGIANAADSLMVIKKLVFEEKKFTLPELVAILKNNYNNQEALRQFIINHIAKYGNDFQEVDQIGAELANLFLYDLKKYKTPRGGNHLGGAISWFSYKTLGNKTGASADGRKERQFLAESLDPVSGRDTEGPTALLNSAAKIDQINAPGTIVISIKLPPKTLEDFKGFSTLKALVASYFAKGGTMVQVNVLDKSTLIAAQSEPEKYKNLIVRVAGFSAYFTTLNKDIQEDLIARAI